MYAWQCIVFKLVFTSIYFTYVLDVDCSISSDGFYRYPTDCSKFIHCANGQLYLNDCPPGLNFNPKINQCDWPAYVDCSPPAISVAESISTTQATSAEKSTFSPNNSLANSGYYVPMLHVSFTVLRCLFTLFVI